jgi:glycosyltransferase involved in cell wall biosynthesis
MIRVLHVLNWFRRGGLETLLLRILRDYDRSRFHMDACCIGADEGYLADEARSYGAEILTCPKSVRFYPFSRRFARLLGGKAYDIVHAHADTWAGPLLRGAHRAGVPVRIAHMHNIVPSKRTVLGRVHVRAGIALLTKWSRRWIARHATRVLGVSEACLDVRWPHWRREPDLYTIWTAGVEIERFATSAGTRSADGAGSILFVGTFTRAKNHDMLINVFATVSREVPEARLRLAGSHGTEEQAIRRLVARRGLEGKVEFLGLRDDIPDLLRTSDAFFSCSRVEGLPIAVLEAEAAGVPVVASDIPPHREALAPELHPFLFPLDDPGKACDSVLMVLKDAALRRRLGEAGRRFVAERFDSAGALRRLQEMYVRWVQEAPAASRP